ncbi:major facilitator superfamily MFS_1 [Novosphingobium nitrogenifigens DSM 19370]|uniref:Major facilitator superfamily MFS_1 n=1 Tax=Novosphingobium nitrogenifigens DSM 19370 TaxID=983920 RepID=F1Z894_9SPHN|nr:MFS transporter [Novosphingobium nitrogenifigens]EGD59131.1 major facilitator superfamily MFS_1 [Novosphingobium nitrogenifigens DSM 19370]
MAIAAVSTVVEWYDFTLYLYLVTVLARVFYGGGQGSLLAALAGFAVSYLMRPLGALALGLLGDRHGRRRAMMTSMAIMTLAMLVTACLPTRAMAGPLAGWLLLVLRCVMAFAVGGEYTGVVAYLVESSPPMRRGLVASLASAASEVGALMAAGVCALVVAFCPPDGLDQWGWRLPFLFGGVLAGAIWIGRAGMTESPEFTDREVHGGLDDHPLSRALGAERAGVLRGFAISALGSITYYVGITYVPAFLVVTGAMGEASALWLSTGAALVVIVVTPLAGLASDRFGRRPMLLGIALTGAVLPLVLFPMMARGGGPALAGAVVLAMIGGAWSAVAAAATAEQFTGAARLSGLALGVTSATAFFGGLAPWGAQRLVAVTGAAWTPGAMIALVALAALPVIARMPETAPRMTER